MKKNILIIALVLFADHLFAQDIWTQKDSVKGTPRSVCASFVIGQEGFVIGGLDLFGFKRKMYSYDPFQNDWDDEPSLGGPNGDGLDRGSACGFSINGKGYICLGQGQTNPYFKDLWEYDPVTQAWTQKADFAGSARRSAVSFSIGDFAYVGTGQDLAGFKKDFYKYDPLLNTWSPIADFAGTARKSAVAFRMGDDGYLGTGDDGVLKNDFWQYRVATNTWIQLASFPGTPRSGAVGWANFPCAYIATGEDNTNSFMNDVWEYNFFSNSWIQRTSIPGPGRKNAIAFMIEGIAYVGTGYNGTFLDDFWGYEGIAGLNETERLFSSSVYPNPSNGSFAISYPEQLGELKVQIIDLSGRVVPISHITHTIPGIVQVETTAVPAGNYMYKLIDGTGNSLSTGKLIVL